MSPCRSTPTHSGALDKVLQNRHNIMWVKRPLCAYHGDMPPPAVTGRTFFPAPRAPSLTVTPQRSSLQNYPLHRSSLFHCHPRSYPIFLRHHLIFWRDKAIFSAKHQKGLVLLWDSNRYRDACDRSILLCPSRRYSERK